MLEELTERNIRATLVGKLATIMGNVERIEKRGKNTFHGYEYAMEADIVASVRQQLADAKVMLIPSVTKIERTPIGEKGQALTTIEMTFTFIDGESGAAISFPWAGVGADKEDKGLYKAMTGGEKYFLMKTFLMPTGDDPERDEKQPPPLTRPKAASPAARLKEVASEKGWASADLRLFLNSRGFAGPVDVNTLPPAKFDALIADIAKGPNAELFK